MSECTLPVLVHIDMKGGPPTLAYLLRLLPVLRGWGATGLLIEWEDMFPYMASLKRIAREGAYSREDVDILLKAAADLNMEVVPLVQTFGHLEFVLKHPEFAHLREVSEFPNCLRPVDADEADGEVNRAVDDVGDGRCVGALNLIREMLRQVLAVHNTGSRLHVGCDEVWCLGQSPATAAVMEAKELSPTDLFLRHVAAVARCAKELQPNIQVLVWDDMARHTSVDKFKRMGIADLVDLVVWNYAPSPSFPSGMMGRYHEVWGSNRVWTGTAWRGATGPCMQATTITHHIQNHLAWIRLSKAGQAGWILTGWSRYDHYATLCELLPVGLPSLRCCLAVLTHKDWNESVHMLCSRELGLADPLLLEPYNPQAMSGPVDEPSFPGSCIYAMLLAYIRLASQYESLVHGPARNAWLNPWQVEKKFINPLQVRTTLLELQSLSSSLQALGSSMSKELPTLLNFFTAEEWVGTHISPKLREIEQIIDGARDFVLNSATFCRQ